jgi:hypothetical protein
MRVLWVDCAGALIAGLAVLLASSWLSELYALPQQLVMGMGVANISYGSYSLSLALRRRRPRHLILLLVAANAVWAILCLCAAIMFTGTASLLGLAHLYAEALFVGWLAAAEWQQRHTLSTPPDIKIRSSL